MRPVTSARQKTGLVLGGIILCLLMLEAGLRIAGWWYNWKHPLPKDRGADYKILCVGESTTFGIGAEDPARDGYPRQLELLLNQRFPGLRAQCLHDQSIGASTSQLLMNFPAALDRYRPDLVIFMAGLNNWWTLNRSNILLFNHNDKVWQFSFKVLGFLDEFRVYKLLKWIFYSQKWISFDSIYQLPDPLVTADPVYMKKREQLLLRELVKLQQEYDFNVFYKVAELDLRQMIKLCLARKIAVVICTYPGHTAQELSAVHRKLAREFGLALVDNDAFFRSLPDKKSYFCLDEVHPNQKGYKVLAGRIFDAILEHRLIR